MPRIPLRVDLPMLAQYLRGAPGKGRCLRIYAIGALCLSTVPFSASRAASNVLTSEFVVSEGLQVTLWAESPMLFKPTNIDVDARGRIWVAEGVNYRTFRGTDVNQPEKIPFRHADGDRIVILEDTDGNGVADSSKVFVQDQDLVAPLGVAVIGNRVFVSCSPNLIAYTMDESGDRPAKKEIFLTGFGGFDHDHGLHSVIAGPDGHLYFNVGNAGPHIVTDKAGWRLRSGSVYTGGTPYNKTNMPGLMSDDGKIYTGGLALRVRPDGQGLRVLAHNFRNSYEVAVDSFGNLWQNDNDDEVRACRTSWLMEGANMGFFSADGARTWRADQRPGQSLVTAQWHQEDPGVCPAGDIYGAGGPTGVAVYEGHLLPGHFRGLVLNCDAGRNTVFAHGPRPDGAGYQLERTVFLTSQRGSTEEYRWDKISMDDQSTWFRPSDVCVGTDGAVYIADWYDPVVGGHAMRSTKGYGRILRVTPKGTEPRAPKLNLATTAGQLEALRNSAINVRFAAWENLREQGERALPQLQKLLEAEEPFIRARALWLLSECGAPGRRIVETTLADPDLNVRIVAIRALRRADTLFTTRHRDLFADPSAAVRREMALALHEVTGADFCQEQLISLLRLFDGHDRFYLEALGGVADRWPEAVYARARRALNQTKPLEWNEAFAAFAWRMHPTNCVADVVARASSAALNPAQRKQAIDTLAFVKAPHAAEAMSELARVGADDVRTNAAWWLRFRAGNDWKTFAAARQFIAAKKADAAQAKALTLEKKLLNQRLGQEEREAAALALAATREGGTFLLKLASQRQLPNELTNTVAEALFRNPDLGVRALASQYFVHTARDGAPFPSVAELVKLRGSPAHGAKLFTSETIGCARCHAIAGQGGDIGPDLTVAATKLGREGLIDSILNPSAVIAAGYEPWLIETKDSELYSGFVVADGDPVILKESTGERRTIPAREIALRQQQKLSLMPDNTATSMTPQELADVVEFLMSASAGEKEAKLNK